MNSKKKFEIKSKTHDILSVSSIHAVPNMVKDNFIAVKLIWFVCFLTSASFCAYFIILSIQEYFNYDKYYQRRQYAFNGTVSRQIF